ncbi:hypothetical protein Stube_13940 [Streptomyces tubercidicus]|uniref:Uncharacterized protein n=1 Tax=Streptomyces tubercidicus TaxID=47759 RepID=A0A640UPT3_9ACTN|nr:hypothetical protein Stube_13940 [Streptomyces tubercidicus]
MPQQAQKNRGGSDNVVLSDPPRISGVRLPAIPAAALATGSRGTQEKTQCPDDEYGYRDIPERLQSESGAEKQQCEKKHE